MKVAVVQTGARRNYAVPLLLHQYDCLSTLITDLAGNTGLGRFSNFAKHLPLISAPATRLSNRKVPHSILERTTTLDWSWLLANVRQAMSANTVGVPRDAMRYGSETFSRVARELTFGASTHLYSMLTEAGPILTECNDHGVVPVCEVYIALSADKIVDEERKRFADWEPREDPSAVARRIDCTRALISGRGMRFVCPSQFVVNDLVANWDVDPTCCRIVPYGVSPLLLQIPNRPKPGTILFLGTANLRKGIQYFVEASRLLTKRRMGLEFIVAGSVSKSVETKAHGSGVIFLGRLPRGEVSKLLSAVDIVVLPSVAEGSAESIFEAMAAEIPVITTFSSGSVVTNEIEGLVVPERNTAALADAIERLTTDRTLRQRMASAAINTARHYTWDQYGLQLVTALRTL